MDEYSHLLSLPNHVFDSSFMQISIYTPESILLVQWKHQITLKQRKKGFLKVLKFIKEYGIKNWLMNNENILFVTQEEKDWILTEWIDLLSQTSLEKAAIVYPNNYDVFIASMYLTQEAEQAYKKKGKIKLRVFMSFVIAVSWLKTGS